VLACHYHAPIYERGM